MVENNGTLVESSVDGLVKGLRLLGQRRIKAFDIDYARYNRNNAAKDNNILVKYDGNSVTDIVNTFQMGAMPFGIVSSFSSSTTGISSINSNVKPQDGKIYNLNGQVVSDNYKGVVIINGKKYLKK